MYYIRWQHKDPASLPHDEPKCGRSQMGFDTLDQALTAINEGFTGILGDPYMYDVVDDNDVAYKPTGHASVPVSKPIQQVIDFHEAFSLAVSAPKNDEAAKNLLELRLRLLREEFNEVVGAVQVVAHYQEHGGSENELKKAWAELLKELSDLRYVTYGFGVSFGLPMDEAFDRVHESNMSKLVNGKPLMREDGKVLKPPTYQPADLTDLI